MPIMNEFFEGVPEWLNQIEIGLGGRMGHLLNVIELKPFSSGLGCVTRGPVLLEEHLSLFLRHLHVEVVHDFLEHLILIAGCIHSPTAASRIFENNHGPQTMIQSDDCLNFGITQSSWYTSSAIRVTQTVPRLSPKVM